MLTLHKKKKALEFATVLDDLKSLAYYEGAFKKYPEKYLEEKLAQVLKIPDEKIKVSRGALFNKLVANRPGKWDYYDQTPERELPYAEETENTWN